ncbi:hypothetical protein JL720_2630 [Aureococcus anophagefferens]|nr:hypothetical protein JL720_2630 [Aureococcus anophagefferens]
MAFAAVATLAVAAPFDDLEAAAAPGTACARPSPPATPTPRPLLPRLRQVPPRALRVVAESAARRRRRRRETNARDDVGLVRARRTPAGKPDGTLKYRDRVLAGEVLKVCYAVAAGRRHDLKDAGAGYLLSPGEAPDDPAVTLIGVCLRAVLCGARAPYDVPPACLDAVNLLTCAPKTYYCWLVENGAVPRLCNLLEGILNDYVGKRQLKEWIFPPEADAVWMPKLAEAKARAKGDEALQKEFDAARIHPVDAPRYATRSLLLKLMCDLEPVTKRLVAELVWALCDEDADEFTVRCGVGNAIAFLQIKKLMPMPKPSF